jgi:hypothetical protein
MCWRLPAVTQPGGRPRRHCSSQTPPSGCRQSPSGGSTSRAVVEAGAEAIVVAYGLTRRSTAAQSPTWAMRPRPAKIRGASEPAAAGRLDACLEAVRGRQLVEQGTHPAPHGPGRQAQLPGDRVVLEPARLQGEQLPRLLVDGRHAHRPRRSHRRPYPARPRGSGGRPAPTGHLLGGPRHPTRGVDTLVRPA